MEFKKGDKVRKTKGSKWQGKIVGQYSTALTPNGYAVESDTEIGSVQIYPASALEMVNPGSLSRADEMISCLEFEVAKRDARITEFEAAVAVARGMQAAMALENDLLRAELAAIKSAPVAKQVVMPKLRPECSSTDDRLEVGYTEGWNGYAEEYERLNAAGHAEGGV